MQEQIKLIFDQFKETRSMAWFTKLVEAMAEQMLAEQPEVGSYSHWGIHG